MPTRWLFTILMATMALAACSSEPRVVEVERDLVAVLKTRPSLTRFTSALEATGVAEALQKEGTYTVFAPMDAAVVGKALDERTLRHHILGERVTFSDLAGENTSYTTLYTDEVEIDATEAIKIGDGLMVESDIVASNGVIHVIDKVLEPEAIPTSLGLAPAAETRSILGNEPVTPRSLIPSPLEPTGDGSTSVIPAAPVVSQ